MDIDKIISAWEHCTSDEGDCDDCPYNNDFNGCMLNLKKDTIKLLKEQQEQIAMMKMAYGDTLRLHKDALELLKEQEPIMMKTVMINGSGRNGRCQNCLMMLNEMDYPNFCGNCGYAVKWE